MPPFQRKVDLHGPLDQERFFFFLRESPYKFYTAKLFGKPLFQPTLLLYTILPPWSPSTSPQLSIVLSLISPFRAHPTTTELEFYHFDGSQVSTVNSSTPSTYKSFSMNEPTNEPTNEPMHQCTNAPTNQPTNQPTSEWMNQPRNDRMTMKEWTST